MADNQDGFAALDAQIARLKRLPNMAREAAPEVAHALERELEQQIAAGTTPDGTKWQPRKDGGQPLTNAAKALTVIAVGTTVFARLTGPVARHHLGRAKGGTVRQILPNKDLPAPVVRAIRATFDAKFHTIMEGQG